MLILADVGNVAGDAHDRLARWIEDGGVLVRFAGPRLAASDDDLVPVRLRRGGRTLGGSLSWDKPQPLAAFSRDSPFNGMPVPNDVTVSRQVLAEPDAALTENTWATLADGTPLVTAARRGKGLIVLFHVTGDTRWSDLPLSGSFRGNAQAHRRAWPAPRRCPDRQTRKTKNVHERVAPTRVLDGFGSFVAPPSTARPVPTDFSGKRHRRPSARLLWPAGEHPGGRTRCPPPTAWRRSIFPRSPMPAMKSTARPSRRICAGRFCWRRSAFCCWTRCIVLYLGGGVARLLSAVVPRRDRGSAGPLGAARSRCRALAPKICRIRMRRARRSKPSSPTSSPATSDVDSVSKAGLGGLTLFLAQRTALEAGEPIGLDISRDELVFYPLIYWPIVPGAARPPRRRSSASIPT